MKKRIRVSHVASSVVLTATLAVAGCASGRSANSPTASEGGASGDVASRGVARGILLDPSDPEWRRAAPARSRLRFETTKGVFVLELVRAWGPIGADRLYNLARLGYYDDARFHRVVPGYIVQWGINGDPAVNAAWKDQQIADDPARSHNVRGTFAFAQLGPGHTNTRDTEIYINLKDNPRSDTESFTVLGTVVEGMVVLDSLYSGYGESSGGGVRQGKQGPLLEGGNAFMDREYPRLDRILRVTVGGSGDGVGTDSCSDSGYRGMPARTPCNLHHGGRTHHNARQGTVRESAGRETQDADPAQTPHNRRDRLHPD